MTLVTPLQVRLVYSQRIEEVLQTKCLYLVLLVGYFGAHRHKPRWTATGVVISGIAMFGLALPNFLFGATSFSEHFINKKMEYINKTICDETRSEDFGSSFFEHCEEKTNTEAYGILVVSQLLAGIAAAPFNTLAYIYIDDNVSNRESPFYLGEHHVKKLIIISH